MNGNDETSTVDSSTEPDLGSTGYERSTISFPYFDLAEALRLAEAISGNVGGGDCTDDQLAAWVKLSSKSSGYRSRISAARMFGLIESGSGTSHHLTELGLTAIDKTRQRSGKAEAFLRVALFKRVFEQWRGQQLPPAAALERQLVQMGVAKKQASRARQVLERSAQQAGFSEQGRDRLVQPAIKGDSETDTPPPPPGGGGGFSGNGGSGTGDFDLDPIIAGLLHRLPASGALWPEAQREIWLDLLKGSFKLIYKEPGPNEHGH